MKLDGKVLLVLVMATVLGACQSVPKDEAAESASSMSETYPSDESGVEGSEEEARRQAEEEARLAEEKARAAVEMSQAELREITVFYFDFDQSKIKPEAIEALKAHARLLSSKRNISVRLEGHADERGTREYNIALGERRGQAVARFLQANGVGVSQIQVVSYGEERPAEFGSGEMAWNKNRRVEIKY